jgi:peptidoglycan hydrolase CwlO-like protein
MAKAPALSTQLKSAQARIVDLEKQLAETARQRDSNATMRQSAETELEQLHQMLDAVPNPILRREEGTYGDRRVITRLAAWLTVRNT